jgi:hypothetical protein
VKKFNLRLHLQWIWQRWTISGRFLFMSFIWILIMFIVRNCRIQKILLDKVKNVTLQSATSRMEIIWIEAWNIPKRKACFRCRHWVWDYLLRSLCSSSDTYIDFNDYYSLEKTYLMRYFSMIYWLLSLHYHSFDRKQNLALKILNTLQRKKLLLSLLKKFENVLNPPTLSLE